MSRRFCVSSAVLVACSSVQALATDPVAFSDTYHLQKNGSKFINLRGFYESAAGIVDSDNFLWNIESGPSYGTITYVDEYSNPSYLYIPDAEYGGTDTITVSFSYYDSNIPATVYSNSAVISLVVTDWNTPPLDINRWPYGMPPPEFGVTESHWTYKCGIDPSTDDYYMFDYGSGPERYHYTENGPYTHYVCPFCDGADDANGLGTPELPRQTIPISLPPGSIVEVHTTLYPLYPDNWADVSIDAATDVNHPVFIRGINGDRPVVLHGIHLHGAAYTIIENIDFDATDVFAVYPTCEWIQVTEDHTGEGPTWIESHHVAIRHCSFMNYGTGVESCGPGAMSFRTSTHDDGLDPSADDALTHHCVVYDCLVGNWGDWTSTDTTDYGACGFAVNTRYMWCFDNVFHHIQSTGVALSRNHGYCDQAPSRDCYVVRNIMHHLKEAALNIKLTENSVISENKISTIHVSSSSLGAAIAIVNNDAIEGHPYSSNIYVMFNEIYDVDQGVVGAHNRYPDMFCAAYGNDILEGCATCEPVSNVYADNGLSILANVFHHIHSSSETNESNYGYAVHLTSLFESAIVNNTFYKCERGIGLGCFDVSPGYEEDHSGAIISNNLFLNVEEKHVDNCRIPIWFLNNCMHYDNYWVRVNGDDPYYDCLASLQSAYSNAYEASSIEGVDPGLADPSNLDFHLNAGSSEPAITGGDLIYAPLIFASYAWGSFLGNPDITQDFDGTYLDEYLYYPIGAFAYYE